MVVSIGSTVDKPTAALLCVNRATSADLAQNCRHTYLLLLEKCFLAPTDKIYTKESQCFFGFCNSLDGSWPVFFSVLDPPTVVQKKEEERKESEKIPKNSRTYYFLVFLL